MKRRHFLVALGAAPLGAFAQQPKVARIGWFGNVSGGSSALLDSFRQGMRDFGHVEGKTYVLEIRWTGGRSEMLPRVAADLVQAKVDVIVTTGTPQTVAAKSATATIPIVMGAAGDPIATGLVGSLARPRGNVTGSAILSSELMLKRFDLLIETFPRARKIAILLNPTNPVQGRSVEATESAAMQRRITVQRFAVSALGELDGAMAEMAKQGFEAVAITQDGLYVESAGTVAGSIARQRLPSIGFPELAEAGGMLGYGVNILAMYRRAAYFVDRILKGAKPGDLPVEQASKFELVVNLRTAKAVGIKIPNSILVRADKVIE